jgi:hypothetical protein
MRMTKPNCRPPRNLGRSRSIGERQTHAATFDRKFGHVRAADRAYLNHLAVLHSERTGVPIEVATRIVEAVAITAQPGEPAP